MTIECYKAECPFHSIHTDPDDGPYCYEKECRVSDLLKIERIGYLEQAIRSCEYLIRNIDSPIYEASNTGITACIKILKELKDE